MDMDITDILASIARPNPSTPTFSPSTTAADHRQLVRAWTNERTTPILLPYPSALITRTTDRLRHQITLIEDLTSTPHPPSQHNANLTLSILQTDLSRTQFLLRSYLRQRLQKLTKHAAYYLALDAERDSKTQLVSDAELRFLRSHQALLTGLYDQAFLQSLPAGLRRLDDASGGAGAKMVEGPDEAVGVLVRCLAEAWGNEDEVRVNGDEGASVLVRMRRGDVLVVRWRDVRAGVLGGSLELL